LAEREGLVEGWNDFCVAVAGTSAALAGLIFVAVSINLDRLLRTPSVEQRTSAALVLLMEVLSISSLVLIPDQATRTVGWEALWIGVIVWLVTTILGIWSDQRIERRDRTSAEIGVAFRQFATVPVLIGGIVMITHDPNGMR
jgi:hypothetical protein